MVANFLQNRVKLGPPNFQALLKFIANFANLNHVEINLDLH